MMQKNKPGCECLEGVHCDVTNCYYNKENRLCSAQEIKVGPQYASTSTDTVCSTFKPE